MKSTGRLHAWHKVPYFYLYFFCTEMSSHGQEPNIWAQFKIGYWQMRMANRKQAQWLTGALANRQQGPGVTAGFRHRHTKLRTSIWTWLDEKVWFYTDKVHLAALDWSQFSFFCKIRTFSLVVWIDDLLMPNNVAFTFTASPLLSTALSFFVNIWRTEPIICWGK